ncbi:DNA polymerase III, delta subunit [Orientia chuto str. Dubai]|uniref:DNA-directed DNA polymerase n=1 Tax=Orientia chuto str. Dubai TaxID=1359168 RepID=A0A0F3MMM0_9RICK|nr:DNA polymerase III subunit delta [Candidatus Orientia mediorientalis]KJV56906.1 DNA polymerase III, delta subunit [Orientia chuto str. Dubai]
MKFTSYNIATLWPAIKKGNIRAAIIYGNDQGLINHRCQEITKLLDANIRTYDYQELTVADFSFILNSSNLFSKHEIVKIYNAPSNINIALKEALAFNNKNFLIILGSEFSTSSTIRQWFETQKYLAALGCYTESSKDMHQLLLKTINQAGKDITAEAAANFSKTIYGNKDFYINEINKLILYCHDCDTISNQDVNKCISTEILGTADLMFIYFAKGLAISFFKEVEKLKNNNIPDVWILRALVRYYINLYVVLMKKENGVKIDQAIKSIHPPIFFKYAQDFQLIAQTKTLHEVLHTLNILYMAELSVKTTNHYTNNSATIFLQISHKLHLNLIN